MMLAFADEIFKEINGTVNVMLAREPCPSHHFQGVRLLGGRIEGGTTENTNKLLAGLEGDCGILALCGGQ